MFCLVIREYKIPLEKLLDAHKQINRQNCIGVSLTLLIILFEEKFTFS